MSDAAAVCAFDPDGATIAEARHRLPRALRGVVAYEVGSAQRSRPRESRSTSGVVWSLRCIEREDVVHVLRRFRDARVPGGALLDLQLVPPEPSVEVDGTTVCRLAGGTLLEDAAAAAAVVDEDLAGGLCGRRLLAASKRPHVVREAYGVRKLRRTS